MNSEIVNKIKKFTLNLLQANNADKIITSKYF